MIIFILIFKFIFCSSLSLIYWKLVFRSDDFELHCVPDETPNYPEHLRVFAKRTADVERFAHFPVYESGHQGICVFQYMAWSTQK